ncbi:nucleotide exchange factor GrpE [Oscillibacter sp.]|uniref:nucleotide exchange factor GrpE n=1 Tax=Oscillibacter sp. TaxID=1945593 RepID=UPI00261DDDA6|nr:nucleotide exchange factor GrpE [Oscillibacter sp.]MDD3346362.1 nucleotide exchange factor GrpE [Oscillibacter sp.]
MSEEQKQPLDEQTPETQTGPEEVHQDASTEEKGDKGGKSKKKKEKGFTFTREQVEQMELAASQLKAAKEQFVRLSAEYDNYRKRTTKEKEGLYQDAKADTIKEFLAVYDNLERAAASEGGEDSPHKKGLEMIFGQYKETLKKLGVTEIEAQGAPFDPERHNAVMHIDDENLGENVVAQVFQAGFLMGEKVIRHAIVQVAN